MTVIEVEDLSKQYRLGTIGSGTLSHDLNRWWHKIRGKDDPYAKIGEVNDRTVAGASDYVWALRDVSFSVREGEVLGIIGKNGAGKSTLLKVLSRTTSPTLGEARIRGRIASLLEVGTGFHPEMTGRENIYLNGAILGMRTREIKRLFDEIVTFAGVERYVDTPVKRYSSGMYVRLAFAVAAHLEPEILIVDEVLAVGDAEFQQKCLGKMKDVSSNHGRTVLFVSHNMAAVKSLCTRALLLKNGMLSYQGDVNHAVGNYLLGGFSQTNHKTFGQGEISNGEVEIREMSVYPKGLTTRDPIVEGHEVAFHVSSIVKPGLAKDYHLTFHLHNEIGEPLFSFGPGRDGVFLKDGPNEITGFFPGKFFNTGSFYITLLVVKDKKKIVLKERDIIAFTVLAGTKELGTYMGREPGYLKPGLAWRQS